MGIIIGAILGAWIYQSYAMKLLRKIRDVGAVNSKNAVTKKEVGCDRGFKSWIIDQFISQGALVKTRKNRIYFNQIGYEEYAKNVRKQRIIGLVILGIIFFLGRIVRS
jgi:hypothetical protein